MPALQLNAVPSQVVHELIETPLKNPSGHGVMVVLRIASEKLGRLAHERQVTRKGTKFVESETVELIRTTRFPVMDSQIQ